MAASPEGKSGLTIYIASFQDFVDRKHAGSGFKNTILRIIICKAFTNS